MNHETVTREVADQVATLTLNRPASLSALFDRRSGSRPTLTKGCGGRA
jgi:hypothetical protein